MAVVTGVVTALDLWRLHERNELSLTLRSGCDSIDSLLRGGFRSGILTEICGEASAGKTQLCLQLLLQSTLPVPLGGLGGTACYICTEGIGSIKRLHELAGVYARKYGSVVASSRKRKRKREELHGETTAAAAQSSNAFLDSIFIEQLYEADDLLGLLEASRRSRMMFHMANCMRILSTQYNVVFVMSNQVTGNFNDNAHQGNSSNASAFKPALGLSWSNCINQRLMIARRPSDTLRRMEIAFSPLCPNDSALFEITSEGVASVDE